MLCTAKAPSLTLKGFTLHAFDPRIRDRWPDKSSPSYCLALNSIVVALVMKSLMCAMFRGQQGLNIEGICTLRELPV